ncbi:hypothetical protein VN1246_10030 [Helicobacter pylori]|nr:hypothetical protein VN1246_10030 [Helicobacter pylori]
MGRFVVPKKKKGFWGVLKYFLRLKWVKIRFNRDSGKNGDSFTWWDRFRFGCKTLRGDFGITFPLTP